MQLVTRHWFPLDFRKRTAQTGFVCGRRQKHYVADVSKVCEILLRDDIWALTNALVARDVNQALQCLHRMLKEQNPPHKIFALVMAKVRDLSILQQHISQQTPLGKSWKHGATREKRSLYYENTPCKSEQFYNEWLQPIVSLILQGRCRRTFTRVDCIPLYTLIVKEGWQLLDSTIIKAVQYIKGKRDESIGSRCIGLICDWCGGSNHW